jgi:DNA polymerase V
MITICKKTLWHCHPSPSKRFLILFGTKVPAGFPSPADDYIDRQLDLHEHLIAHPAATFFVTASGESMQGEGIFDKDMLIVDRSYKPKSGDIVIAVVDGLFTVKKLIVTNGTITLMPANPKFSEINITDQMDLDVWGVVTHVIHYCHR